MGRGKRALIATLVATLSAPLLAWLASEGVVVYEMLDTGATSRGELGDDLGLGVLLFLMVKPLTLAGVVAVWFGVWRYSGPKAKDKISR